MSSSNTPPSFDYERLEAQALKCYDEVCELLRQGRDYPMVAANGRLAFAALRSIVVGFGLRFEAMNDLELLR